ncbi:hypothetical protein AAFN75_02430 [Algibacter sp. AS12]|uniref:hypothetical protein n=1 Tax=Algibacter sp. AS12 TaxID=3135773 RepID=UPI00398B0542
MFLSINAFSQNLECGQSIDSVKSTLAGQWKLKALNTNKTYRFWFNQDAGFVEVLEELNLPPKAEHTEIGRLVKNDQAAVNIKLIEGVFFIEMVYPFGTVSEQIVKLNKNTFVYGQGTTAHYFVKDVN